jgi:type IV pilus assembly protein PilY1
VSVEGEQFVKSYFIADKTNNTQDSWAAAGGTKAALSLGDPEELIKNLKDLLGGIISESSSLVSESVPANVYNRAETLDNLFLAIFQAEAGPRWPGNIKKLKIVAVPSFDELGNLVALRTEIQDTLGEPAFSAEDGRINHSALTFWTDPDGLDVTPAITDPTDSDYPLEEDEVVGKDGRSVERGGAGQQVPGFLVETSGDCADTGPGAVNSDTCARQLFSESPSGDGSLIDFDQDDATAELLKTLLDQDAADVDEAKEIIGWARGLYDRAADGSRVTTQRWLMGDPIHSRPLAINYGDTDGTGGYDRDNPNIHLFFGSNDGWFRSIRNTDSAGVSSQSGEEAWGFMPLEVMHKQQVLSKDNRIKAEDWHPYGVDGRPVALVIDNDSDGNIETGDDDKVHVYVGLRRGGKAYYALDVSNPNASTNGVAVSSPELLWKITDSDTGFAQLGLTFSTPQLATVNFNGAQKKVLVFGGGYHGGWNDAGSARIGKDLNSNEDSTGTTTGSPVGTAIYVVDAISGDLLWKAENAASTTGVITNATDSVAGVYGHADLDHSIPSDMVVVDTDQNGVEDRAYVGDSGGNVWRIDLPENSSDADSRDSWRITKLAELGDNSASGDRRFFHAPDVVLARDTENIGTVDSPQLANRRYIGVAIGSGDRAAPNDTDAVNFMHYIKDPITTFNASALDAWTPFKPAGSASGVALGGLLDITDCPVGDESSCGFNDELAKIGNLVNGWGLELEATGEKSLSTAITIQGTVFFTTYLPEGDDEAGACAPSLGTGRLYAVNIRDGAAAFDLDSSVGGDDKADRFIDLEVPGIPPEPPFITTPPYDHDDDPDTPPIYPDDEGALVLPGGNIFNINGRFQWKAYWREVGVDPI